MGLTDTDVGNLWKQKRRNVRNGNENVLARKSQIVESSRLVWLRKPDFKTIAQISLASEKTIVQIRLASETNRWQMMTTRIAHRRQCSRRSFPCRRLVKREQKMQQRQPRKMS